MYTIKITAPSFDKLDELTQWVNKYLIDIDRTVHIDILKDNEQIGYYQDAIYGLMPVKRENGKEIIIYDRDN